MKCHLILNPLSHGGKAKGKFDAIFRLMRRAGIEFDYSFASGFESIREAAANAHSGDYDALVAVGGDGTINAVINGFFNDDGTLRSDKMMGVIYTGTSPDFCKSYGIPLEPGDAVDAIKKGCVRKILPGRIRLAGSSDAMHETTRYFSCCASIGIGAMVAEKANRWRKYLGDSAGTFVAILSSLAKFRTREITLTFESEERKFYKVTNIFIGRTKYIASGLQVHEEIQDNDDRFYILCVHSLNAWRLPGLLRQLYTGHTVTSGVMEVLYANEVRIQPAKDSSPIEFDGDPAGQTPCSIKSSGVPLSLIVACRQSFMDNE